MISHHQQQYLIRWHPLNIYGATGYMIIRKYIRDNYQIGYSKPHYFNHFFIIFADFLYINIFH
jgi:hypothetical protein